MSPPRVAVLMSTYNGARHLEAQLDSLRAQENVEVRVHVRDDGSTDDTLALLKRYAAGWPNLNPPMQGPNLGPAASFLELLRTAPDDADYYAFCDQDDVWLPRKLARAVGRLSASGRQPALYCSNVTCVDDKLAVLGTPRENGDARLQHLLFENIAYGCTTVMNRAAREAIAARPPERGVIMHDWWCALVVAALGEIQYDPEPHILYRQHGGNAIGGHVDPFSQTLNQAVLFLRNPTGYYRIHAQASELLRLCGADITPELRALVERLVLSKRSLPARVGYALSGHIVRSRLLGAIVARGLVVAGWY
jgi:glycosyltransferase involved in cell wall biosynthesis